MSNTRIMYLREGYHQGNTNPIGCVAIKLMPVNGKAKRTMDLHYQVSVLNPVDKFDRQTARLFAKGRLLDNPLIVGNVPEDASINEITQVVMAEIVMNNKLPTRARKGAARWFGYDSYRACARDLQKSLAF